MFRDLEIWLNHFEYHSQHPRRVPGGLSDVLKPEERRLIARSLAVFQLGEQCEGRSLMRAVWRYARTHNAPALVRITEIFIREEQRHAALLQAFMEDHGLELQRTDWTDFVFCCLRRIGGFESRLYVFVTAELIASVYYRALEAVTGCQRLKVLCRTLVADELAHIGLQSQLLLTLRANESAFARGAARLVHRTFFMTTAAVVYAAHRRVLRAVGYDLAAFMRACSSQYDFYLEPPRRWRESSPAVR
jgi:hypothetical protein